MLQNKEDIGGCQVVREVVDHNGSQARTHILVSSIQCCQGGRHRLNNDRLTVQVSEIVTIYIIILETVRPTFVLITKLIKFCILSLFWGGHGDL